VALWSQGPPEYLTNSVNSPETLPSKSENLPPFCASSCDKFRVNARTIWNQAAQSGRWIAEKSCGNDPPRVFTDDIYAAGKNNINLGSSGKSLPFRNIFGRCVSSRLTVVFLVTEWLPSCFVYRDQSTMVSCWLNSSPNKTTHN